jgi:hypothetical protein
MCELQGLCNAGEVRPPASQRPLVNPLMRFLALPTVRSRPARAIEAKVPITRPACNYMDVIREGKRQVTRPRRGSSSSSTPTSTSDWLSSPATSTA